MIERRKIPIINKLEMKVGQSGLITRSYPVKPDSFYRIYQDEALVIRIHFSEVHEKLKVNLYTNIGSADDQWEEVEMTRVNEHEFMLDMNATCCGNFLFKIKYSFNGGKDWFWDKVPFTKVIVDPSSCKDTRIYTFIPNISGPISQWKTHLSHIKEMGFNVIHLLPITSYDISESPYAAADYFSIDRSLLDNDSANDGLSQLEEFVEFSKQENVSLCFDLVFNHAGLTSKIATERPGWIVPDKNEDNGLMRTGCWHMNEWIKWEDLVKIYYDHPDPDIQKEIWEYMLEYAMFWAQYADYTGGMVRFDNLHSSHEGFVKYLISSLRKEFPNLIILGELFTDSNTLLRYASDLEMNLFLGNQWEYPFAYQLREYISHVHDLGKQVRHFIPLTTHDTGSPTQMYGSVESTVPRYVVLALMGTGQTGIVQGVEHGVAEKVEFIGVDQEPDYVFPDRYNQFFKDINTLLAENQTFKVGGNLQFIDHNHGAVLAAYRYGQEASDADFFVMANMDPNSGYDMSFDLREIKTGAARYIFTDVFTEEEMITDNQHLQLWIDAAAYRLFRVRSVQG